MSSTSTSTHLGSMRSTCWSTARTTRVGSARPVPRPWARSSPTSRVSGCRPKLCCTTTPISPVDRCRCASRSRGSRCSGTTVLHRLLGCDPDVDFLPTWQAFRPVPSGRCAPADDPRRDEMNAMVEMMRQMGALAVHPMATDEPEEEVFLLQHSFASLLAELNCPLPSYVEFLATRDQRDAYEFVFDLIRLNQWAADALFDRPARRQVTAVPLRPRHRARRDARRDRRVGCTAIRSRSSARTAASTRTGGNGSWTTSISRRSVANASPKLERIARRGAAARAQQPDRFVDVDYTAHAAGAAHRARRGVRRGRARTDR